MTKEVEKLDLQNVNNIIGVDLGINFIATTYDSKGKTTFFKGRTVKHKRGHFKAIRKECQQHQTVSSHQRIRKTGH